MKLTTESPERSYDNSHRVAQAARTREAILDALIRVMARGVAELSIPAVAREAGVSVRTVYRNFPTKRDLIAATNDYLDSRVGYSLSPYPRDLDQLAAHVRRYFRGLDGADDLSRAALVSQIWREMRPVILVEKMRAIESALDSCADGLAASDRTRLANVVAVLFSQSTLQRMRDEFGLSADAAAESVVWAIRLLVNAAIDGANAPS